MVMTLEEQLSKPLNIATPFLKDSLSMCLHILRKFGAVSSNRWLKSSSARG